MRDAYWHGKPWPEEARLAIHRAREIAEDWFTATAADFKTMMEGDDG